MSGHYPTATEFKSMLARLLGPERAFYRVVLIYSMAISLLGLALPISVQLLIDTVANTALIQPVMVIALVLFGLLLVAGVLYALRAYAMELFKRHFYARIASEIALTAMNAKTTFFEEAPRQDLFNRYFDIMTVKKNLPHVLSNGFSLFLQSCIGFLLVSLYHWTLLIFNLALILMLYLIWRLWGWRAICTAFALSEAKYQTAAWLEGLTINQGFFKSGRHVNYALEQTNQLIHQHVDAQSRHFRFRFSQLLSLLLLYALASAVLLGMGGVLVIQGQLSLGQLVAAELIMSAIFAGFPQLATYLGQCYEIAAAVEELSRFKQVPLEPGAEINSTQEVNQAGLQMQRVSYRDSAQAYDFSLSINSGQRLLAKASSADIQQVFTLLLKRHIEPNSGAISLCELDLLHCNPFDLRQHVVVIDRPTLLPISIADYLQLAAPHTSGQRRDDVLNAVGLDQRIAKLPQGIQTMLTSNGWPLYNDEAMRLKLAAAILAQPRLIILSQHFDMVDAAHLNQALDLLCADHSCSVIYFTQRQDLHAIDGYLQLDYHRQQLSRKDHTPRDGSGEPGENA